MDRDDVLEVFVGTLAAAIVFWFVVVPLLGGGPRHRRFRGRRRLRHN